MRSCLAPPEVCLYCYKSAAIGERGSTRPAKKLGRESDGFWMHGTQGFLLRTWTPVQPCQSNSAAHKGRRTQWRRTEDGEDGGEICGGGGLSLNVLTQAQWVGGWKIGQFSWGEMRNNRAARSPAWINVMDLRSNWMRRKGGESWVWIEPLWAVANCLQQKINWGATLASGREE